MHLQNWHFRHLLDMQQKLWVIQHKYQWDYGGYQLEVRCKTILINFSNILYKRNEFTRLEKKGKYAEFF